jgi:hypothetical protein
MNPDPVRLTRSLRVSWCLVLAVLSMSACTHTQKPVITVKALPPAQASAGSRPMFLVMDDAFRQYTFEFGKMGDTWKYPLGEALVDYARNVTQHVFPGVTEATAAPADGGWVLQPAVGKMDHASGLLAWQDRTLVLRVEWALRNAGDSRTLWLSTVEGKASHAAGNLFTGKGNERKLFQMLFDDLTEATVRELRLALPASAAGN